MTGILCIFAIVFIFIVYHHHCVHHLILFIRSSSTGSGYTAVRPVSPFSLQSSLESSTILERSERSSFNRGSLNLSSSPIAPSGKGERGVNRNSVLMSAATTDQGSRRSSRSGR